MLPIKEVHAGREVTRQQSKRDVTKKGNAQVTVSDVESRNSLPSLPLPAPSLGMDEDYHLHFMKQTFEASTRIEAMKEMSLISPASGRKLMINRLKLI